MMRTWMPTGPRKQPTKLRRALFLTLALVLAAAVVSFASGAHTSESHERAQLNQAQLCNWLVGERPGVRSAICRQLAASGEVVLPVHERPAASLEQKIAKMLMRRYHSKPDGSASQQQQQQQQQTETSQMQLEVEQEERGVPEVFSRNIRMILDPALESMASRVQSDALSSFLMDSVRSDSNGATGGTGSGSGGGGGASDVDGKSMFLEQVENRWQPMRGKRARRQ